MLSGAADMRLKVWSAEDGLSPATLTGHCYGKFELKNKPKLETDDLIKKA